MTRQAGGDGHRHPLTTLAGIVFLLLALVIGTSPCWLWLL